MSRVGNEIPIVALVAFLSEVLSTSTSRILSKKQEISDRMISIKKEMDELKDLADGKELKDKNLKRREQSLKNKLGDDFESQESEILTLYQDISDRLDAGNDLLWIGEKLKDLFLEYQQLKFIELPKLEIYEFLHKAENTGVYSIIVRLKDKVIEIRDRLDESLTKLDDVEEQASNVPFPYGPIIVFLIKKVKEFLIQNVFNPIKDAVSGLITGIEIDDTLNPK